MRRRIKIITGRRPAGLLFIALILSLLAAVSCQASLEQTPTAEPDVTPVVTEEPEATATVTERASRPPATPTAARTRTPEPATPEATRTAGSAEPTPTASPLPTSEESSTPVPETATPDGESSTPGALIAVSMESQVGVVLDEIPSADRARIAELIQEQPDAFWLGRALRQVRMTKLRLNFRGFSYEERGQLPLPPPELWNITLDDGGPSRQRIDGHDVVVLAYTFTTTILADTESPARVEPALAQTGGVWEEPFVFPVDPDFLLQRTGNACIDEGGYPPNSYDAENVWHFYDYTCTADSAGVLGCHRTQLPNLSCREALVAFVGEVETLIRFERLAWDEALADEVRLGEITAPEAPDLDVVETDLEVNRIVYRWIEPDDCALEEGAVGGSGWRRLLQFAATVHNVGGAALHVGEVTAEDHENHVFEYSPCHDHFHYSHYGDFYLDDPGDVSTSKRAFCVQSTTRLSNNESSPLDHSYSCRFQGIQTGWADEYIAGLDTQWIDITDVDVGEDGAEVDLAFYSNEDTFLCEGMLVRDESGAVVWEPSGLETEDGESINRPACALIPDWDENNVGEQPVFVPAVGSFVTAECAEGEFGPLRNCGFTLLTEDEPEMCQVGQPVEMALSVEEPDERQILRVCEWSDVLGTGLACTYNDAVANAIVSEATTLSFTCPLIRDSDESEGGYSFYVAPLWSEDELQELVPAAEEED